MRLSYEASVLRWSRDSRDGITHLRGSSEVDYFDPKIRLAALEAKGGQGQILEPFVELPSASISHRSVLTVADVNMLPRGQACKRTLKLVEDVR